MDTDINYSARKAT